MNATTPAPPTYVNVYEVAVLTAPIPSEDWPGACHAVLSLTQEELEVRFSLTFAQAGRACQRAFWAYTHGAEQVPSIALPDALYLEVRYAGAERTA